MNINDIQTFLSQINQKSQLTEKTQRPWGNYFVIAQEKNFLLKIIEVEPKETLSKQFHNHREEKWIVLEGIAKVLKGNKQLTLNKGETIFIEKKEIHSLSNLQNKTLKVLEIQKGEYLSEDDIVRIEDKYGRV